MSVSHNQIRSTIETAEARAALGAWGVVVGLILEIMLAASMSCESEYKEFGNVGNILANCLIALGVTAEIKFGRKASQGYAELRSRADTRAARLEKEAADARGRVADIERFTAWRHLSDQQIESMSELMHPLANELDVLVEYEQGNPEAYSFAKAIALALTCAGCKGVKIGTTRSHKPDVFGLYLSALPSVNITCLADAFLQVGIDLSITTEITNLIELPDGSANSFIFVAAKPPPPLLEIITDSNTRSRSEAMN